MRPCVLVAFFAGLCWDGYALRRVMDCGRLSFALKPARIVQPLTIIPHHTTRQLVVLSLYEGSCPPRTTCFAGTSGTNLRLLLPKVLIFIVFRFLESSKMLRYDRLADIRQAYATDELFRLADLLPHFAGLKPLNQEVQ